MPKKGEKCTEKQLAALHAGKKDFISGDERTKAIQAQGTKAAAELRTQEAQKRTFAQHLAEALAITTAEGKTRKHGVAEGLVKALEKELAKKSPNGKTVNALYTAIRDTIGEMPSQKIDINANVKTIGNWRDVLKDKAENAGSVEGVENSTSETERERENGTDDTNDTNDKSEGGGDRDSIGSENGGRGEHEDNSPATVEE